MADHNELGKLGEEMALKFVLDKGYKVLHINWLYKKEELDIVAIHENQIVFIEVKTRSHDLFETPGSTVPFKKQNFLIRAAAEYFSMFNIQLEYRFDIIFIIHNPSFTRITHIEDAFFPTIAS